MRILFNRQNYNKPNPIKTNTHTRRKLRIRIILDVFDNTASKHTNKSQKYHQQTIKIRTAIQTGQHLHLKFIATVAKLKTRVDNCETCSTHENARFL